MSLMNSQLKAYEFRVVRASTKSKNETSQFYEEFATESALEKSERFIQWDE